MKIHVLVAATELLPLRLLGQREAAPRSGYANTK